MKFYRLQHKTEPFKFKIIGWYHSLEEAQASVSNEDIVWEPGPFHTWRGYENMSIRTKYFISRVTILGVMKNDRI